MKEEKQKKEKEEIAEDSVRYLRPKDTIRIFGYVSYKESMQKWSIINLRKEILNLFPELGEKRSKFIYSMYYTQSSKELKKIIDCFEKKDVMPILLMLGKVKDR